MKFREAREKILKILEKKETRSVTPRELSKMLGLRGKSLKSLQKWLARLVRDAEIVQTPNKRISLPSDEMVLTGTLHVFRSGNGIVSDPKEGKEAFVFKGSIGRAIHGDTVLVRLQPLDTEIRADSYASRRGRGTRRPEALSRSPSGRIIRIVERSQKDLVGTLKQIGRWVFVQPFEPSYTRPYRVEDNQGALLNDRVMVRYAGWERGEDSPRGEIQEVLGPAGDPSIDTLSVMRQYDLPDAFPDIVQTEADEAAELALDPGERQDLRDCFVVTIDPERARDFDDAISLETNQDGQQVLGVHIADVSHFVRPGTALDKEARTRGTSVYLPDRVIPMLPEVLSNGVCTLRPGEERLALSVFLTLNSDGRIIKRSFAKTRIQSNVRLTYEEAMAIIDDDNDESRAEVAPLLKKLHALAQKLRQQRFDRYALDLDIPECEIETDHNGHVTGLRLVSSDPSHQLIEECMVAANEAVAAELAHHHVGIISRLHEPPDPEKLKELAVNLIEMGYKPGNLEQPRNLAALLKTIKDDPLGSLVRMMVLRSMKKAMYSSSSRGHFGLAKDFYSHFTSPIRRYPDLITHRQISRLLSRTGERGEQALYDPNELEVMARWSSDRERNAEEAERTLVEIMKYRFLQEQIENGSREKYEATIVRVLRFGVFVEVPLLQLQGLVHISELSRQHGGSRSRYDRSQQRIVVGRHFYGLGTRVKVAVSRVDMENRQVDFSLPLQSSPVKKPG